VTQWKAHGKERIMLRIFADSAPGYLRGKAFDTYQGSSHDTSYTAWVATTVRKPLVPNNVGRTPPRVRAGYRVYDLTSSPLPDAQVLDVWPEQGTTARIFTPLGATRLGIRAIDVGVDDHDIVTFNDGEVGRPYIVFTEAATDLQSPGSAEPPSGEYRESLTSFDRHIDDEVRDLASRLFADCQSTRDKIDAVRSYFLDNYSYRLGIDVPHRMDPVTFFLTKQPPAHCEYFATGTAVLLRLADVPCRYVVGYVSQEWNPIGNFWVARNKDAHAWVEAYDEDERAWVIVESTPASGVPQPREAHLLAQVSDSIRHGVGILRIRIQEYGLLATLYSLVEVIWSIPGLTVLLGLSAVMLLRYRPASLGRRSRERSPKHLREMHAALSVLDRRVREQGLERSPEETLSHFSERLRVSSGDPSWTAAAADSYALYVELRYQWQLSPDAVDRFRRSVEALPHVASTRHGSDEAGSIDSRPAMTEQHDY
jgi:transglutaminase-like putative cysteine protease